MTAKWTRDGGGFGFGALRQAFEAGHIWKAVKLVSYRTFDEPATSEPATPSELLFVESLNQEHFADGAVARVMGFPGGSRKLEANVARRLPGSEVITQGRLGREKCYWEVSWAQLLARHIRNELTDLDTLEIGTFPITEQEHAFSRRVHDALDAGSPGCGFAWDPYNCCVLVMMPSETLWELMDAVGWAAHRDEGRMHWRTYRQVSSVFLHMLRNPETKHAPLDKSWLLGLPSQTSAVWRAAFMAAIPVWPHAAPALWLSPHVFHVLVYCRGIVSKLKEAPMWQE